MPKRRQIRLIASTRFMTRSGARTCSGTLWDAAVRTAEPQAWMEKALSRSSRGVWKYGWMDPMEELKTKTIGQGPCDGCLSRNRMGSNGR